MDTLQKIREVSKNGASYADDYQVIGTLKQFADQHGICVLIVHHTRKTPAGDKFNMISGTTGLLGCADGALVLLKSSRTENSATLDITGRDQPDQKLYLVRDMDHLTWQYESSEKEEQLMKNDALLERVAAFMTEDKTTWTGSAAELASLLGESIQPNILTRRLNVNHDVLKSKYGICYASRHTRSGSMICLTREEQTT